MPLDIVQVEQGEWELTSNVVYFYSRLTLPVADLGSASNYMREGYAVIACEQNSLTTDGNNRVKCTNAYQINIGPGGILWQPIPQGYGVIGCESGTWHFDSDRWICPDPQLVTDQIPQVEITGTQPVWWTDVDITPLVEIGGYGLGLAVALIFAVAIKSRYS